MGDTIHYLKTETEYFRATLAGTKTFEIRLNDRNFKVGDFIILREILQGNSTGQTLPPKEITYIFHGGEHGLDPRYCILQLGRSVEKIKERRLNNERHFS